MGNPRFKYRYNSCCIIKALCSSGVSCCPIIPHKNCKSLYNADFWENLMRIKFLLFAVLLFSVSYIQAEGDKHGNINTPAQTNGSPTRTYLDINKICTQFLNDGKSNTDASGNSAFTYPAGSGKTCIFATSFLWGGYIEGDAQVRVGGSAYGTGLQGGKITNSGVSWNLLTHESTTADNVRIYRTRADIYPGASGYDLSTAAGYEATSASALATQYLKDYNEWPFRDGAPYYVNNSGIRIPGIKGADQTIWFVANDLNQKLTTNFYGTNPIGIEFQATYWAYNQSGALGNTIFRKYKIINKSNTPVNNMIVSLFSDPDIGNPTDDYAGCDTTLNLGYAYNASATDVSYSPLPPPAIGYVLLQGPKVAGVSGHDINKNSVDDAADYATVNGIKYGPGCINLPMTSFYYFANGDASVTDPTIGANSGATQFYNFFQGKVGLTGAMFTNPSTNASTPFALSGDPSAKTGWLDGTLIAAGDRRIGLGSGSFNLAVGDTQEIVIAEIVAGGITGIDRLSAVGLLKSYVAQVKTAYNSLASIPTAIRDENQKPASFELHQNYPNPFNPATKIGFSLSNPGHVSLKIFDLLGREVATLADGEVSAGFHSVDFNASNLASGTYFYKLTSGEGSFVKKMMILK